MPNLVDQTIAAHGGMERWRQVSGLRVRFSSGGLLLTSKWKHWALRNIEGIVDVSRPRTVLFPYPGPGRRGVFEPDRVWIEDGQGRVAEERSQPRSAFRRARRTVWWDSLDVLYFAGYALWNYLCAPFFFVRPGFETEELKPWNEKAERWRRLRVTFPVDIPSHCREQVFYFDAQGLLRRLDYTAEPVGSWARAAHYCFEHRTFSGLVFPTRRRVVPRRTDGQARAAPTLVWIDVNEIAVESRSPSSSPY